MYLPSHFAEDRPGIMHDFVHAHPLATLVTRQQGVLQADHIPFLLEEPYPGAPSGLLRGHVARANPLWQHAGGSEVLVVFQGASAYVSPSLYEDKQVSGKVVPTYNYAAVHAHGVLSVFDDPQRLLATVEALTKRFETGRAAPWAVADAPRDFIDKLLGAIVGIEIAVTRMEGKWKVGQNRPASDQANIAEEAPQLRDLMRQAATRKAPPA